MFLLLLMWVSGQRNFIINHSAFAWIYAKFSIYFSIITFLFYLYIHFFKILYIGLFILDYILLKYQTFLFL